MNFDDFYSTIDTEATQNTERLIKPNEITPFLIKLNRRAE